MLFPFNVDVPMERIPFMNWIVIGLTVLVSMLIMVEQPMDLIAALVLQRHEGFGLLQLPGYLLVHAGPIHLIGNMIFLFCFGNAVNAKLGQATFLLFYVIAGSLAGLAWLLLGQGLFLVGASGAIMGVTGAFLILYPRNDVSVFYIFFNGIGTFYTSSFVIILVYLGFDVLGLVLSGGGAVAYIAHVVGALCGMAVAAGLLLSGYIESTRYEQNLLQILKIQP